MTIVAPTPWIGSDLESIPTALPSGRASMHQPDASQAHSAPSSRLLPAHEALALDLQRRGICSAVAIPMSSA